MRDSVVLYYDKFQVYVSLKILVIKSEASKRSVIVNIPLNYLLFFYCYFIIILCLLSLKYIVYYICLILMIFFYIVKK